jgi:outer membrane protein assembly factor BamB
MGASTEKKRTYPAWLIGFWLVAAGAIVGLSFYEVNGDPGISNLLRFATINVALLVTVLWFLSTSRFSARVRLGGFLLIAIGAGLFFTLFRVGGVRGGLSMPSFALRWGEPSWEALEAPVGSARSADLTRTSRHDFAGFLGSNRDLKVDSALLETDLEANAPELLWRQPIGKGWSGFAVVNGFAVTLEQRGESEMVTLYDVDTGELRWAYEATTGEPFEAVVAGAGPRSTPLIDEGVVYAQTVYGSLLALDGATGRLLWRRDLSADQGLSLDREKELYAYGRSGSPLVVGDRVIVPLGGDPSSRVASLAAYDKKSGELLWQGGSRQFNMASPQYARLGGVEQILMVNEGSVNGYDLADGRELWSFPWPGQTSGDSSVSQAVGVGDDRVFASKGYGHGAALYRLLPSGDGTFTPEAIWQSSRVMRTKFTNAVFLDGHVYGLSEGVLECIELATGERVWKHGRYGHGQILLAGEVLLVLTEDGEMVFVEATPDRRDRVFGRFQAVDGQTWNTFALSGDRLLVRNANEAAAYRLATRASRP